MTKEKKKKKTYHYTSIKLWCFNQIC